MNSSRSRQKRNPLSREAFDKLLSWLDPDRNLAGEKYEKIRRGLVRMFVGRGCFEAEELADQTIDRVVNKLDEIAHSYVGDKALYFYGVAQNIYREWVKGQAVRYRPLPEETPEEENPEEEDPRYLCLEQCLDQLDKDSRSLILNFHQLEKRGGIENRKVMARQLGITGVALRMRAHRLRGRLRECIEKCLERG